MRDEADARSLLAEVSGQPLKPWCRAHNINAHSLYWWRIKLFGATVRRPAPIAEVTSRACPSPSTC